VREAASGRIVAGRVPRAERWWQRAVGLLGRRGLAQDEGLLLVPCRAVHMMGMRFAIDVALLARDGRIVATASHLAPGARTAAHREAHAALELPAGALQRFDLAPGAVLEWEEVP
jgi:uncharacterized membrane protein (UPF0127 family)